MNRVWRAIGTQSTVEGRALMMMCFFFSSRRRHTRLTCDWSSDVVLFRSCRPSASAPPRTRKGRPMTSWRDGLPPALPSMWRLLKLGYRHEPWLLVAAFGLSQIAALPDALLALWLKLLGEGLLQDDRGRVLVAAVVLGLSATATWFLRTVSTRVQRRFRDKVTVALESHVARLQASLAT